MEKKKIVEIQKNLNYSEVKYKLLYFSKRYEYLMPKPSEAVTVIEEDGRKYVSKIHSYGYRIDGLKDLYSNYNVEEGDQITIELDENHKDVIRVFFDKYENVVDQEISEDNGVSIMPFENDLRDFVANNLSSIKQGLTLVGTEYPVNDKCHIDILCQEANGDFVVIELKKNSTNDKAVGQISRYMGWVKENLAPDKNVTGIILTGKPKENDKGDRNLRYAVSTHPAIELRYYDITLKIV